MKAETSSTLHSEGEGLYVKVGVVMAGADALLALPTLVCSTLAVTMVLMGAEVESSSPS